MFEDLPFVASGTFKTFLKLFITFKSHEYFYKKKILENRWRSRFFYRSYNMMEDHFFVFTI